MTTRTEGDGRDLDAPVIWLSPSARLARLGDVLERLAPGVAFTSDVADLASSDPDAARVLVLDAESVPVEDVGFVRRYVARARDVRVTVVGEDAGARVARLLLALPRTSWMAWPPDLDAILSLAHGHDLPPRDEGTQRTPDEPPRPRPSALRPEPRARPAAVRSESEPIVESPLAPPRVERPFGATPAPSRPSFESRPRATGAGAERDELDEIQAILEGSTLLEDRPAPRPRQEAPASGSHTHPARTALAPDPGPFATSLETGTAARESSAVRSSGGEADAGPFDAAFEVAFRDTPVAPKLARARNDAEDDAEEDGEDDTHDDGSEHDADDVFAAQEESPRSRREASEARALFARAFAPDPAPTSPTPAPPVHDVASAQATGERESLAGSSGTPHDVRSTSIPAGDAPREPGVPSAATTTGVAPFGPKDAPPWWRAQVADLADAAQRVQLSMSALRAVEPDDENELRDHVDQVDAEVARIVQFARTLGFVAAPPARGEQVFDLSDTVQLFMSQLASRPGGSPRCQFRALEPVYVRSDRALIGTAFDAFFWLAGACSAPGEVVRAQVRRENDLAEVRVEFPAGPLAGLESARILEPYGVRRILPDLGPNALSAASAIVFGQGGGVWLTSFPSVRLGWRIVLPCVDAPNRPTR